MFKRLAVWLKDRKHAKFFEAFQIEVTSRCIMRCEMCPRSRLADRWPEIDLPWEAFERIARTFSQVQHVHLQGWGEPLLHPRLFEMIARAKAAGCRVGLTTNGMGLDQDMGKQLLDLSLDLLSVSIAGATRETHDRIRVNSSLSTILENVRRFQEMRGTQRGKGPKVELSYLMTRTNIAELPQAVELANSLGVDEVYAINLDYVVTPAHDNLRVFDSPPLREDHAAAVRQARELARRIGLAFRSYPLDLDEVAICEARPTKIVFFSCEGWVSPCTYCTLPGQTEIPRMFMGEQVSVPVVRFGNVLEKDFEEIWDGQAYRAFRQRFSQRGTEAATRALIAAIGDTSCDADLPPAPDPCLTCYKLYGV